MTPEQIDVNLMIMIMIVDFKTFQGVFNSLALGIFEWNIRWLILSN